MTRIDEQPQQGRSAGLQEFGLPYAADPVVSKHLARFLTRSLANVKASETLSALVGDDALNGDFLAPTAVLFNGGVFKAAPLRQRVLDLLASWRQGDPVRELEGFQPDLAVAKGASFYGRTRATGKGIRIKAGAARSYYIGLETSMPAVPGFKPPVKALCVVPQGMEEGTELLIEGQEFGLVTGQPAEFGFLFRGSQRRYAGRHSAQRRTRTGRNQLDRDQPAAHGRCPRRSGPTGANQSGGDGTGDAGTVDEARQFRTPLEGRISSENGIAPNIRPEPT